MKNGVRCHNDVAAEKIVYAFIMTRKVMTQK